VSAGECNGFRSPGIMPKSLAGKDTQQILTTDPRAVATQTRRNRLPFLIDG
jgi:hypothetical protein